MKKNKPYDKPYYDRRMKCWRMSTEHGEEYGDALYIASELIKTGVVYPFHSEPPETEKYHDHQHGFSAVIAFVLSGPKYFSIDGFEEYYSKQEQLMLKKLWEKISE